MERETRAALAELNRQINRLRAEGKSINEVVTVHAQKGTIYASQGQWAASAAEFDRSAKEAAEVGDMAAEALARYGQALALFFLPGRLQETKQALERAIELAEQIGHRPLAAKAYFILSSFRLNAGDFFGSAAELSQAIDRLDAATEPQLALQLYQTRASVNFMCARLDQARADLDQALAAAKHTGDKNLILSVQLDQQILQNFNITDGPTSSPELFDSLLAQAQQMGNKQVAGDAKLHQAIAFLQTGQYKRALRRAQQIRQTALQATDHMRYIRYLLACVLMAESQNHLGDRTGVLATLLTCKKSLEGALGKDVGQLVVPFLESLRHRWGVEALQEALDSYQKQMAQI